MNASNSMKFTVLAAVLLAVFAILPIQLIGQTETGQIAGTVLDPSGAVVMTATVTAVDVDTKATRVQMSSDGNYAIPNLLPGKYEVSASAPGFETAKQAVTVAVGTKLGLDFHLTLGSTTTVVEVQENIVQVNTETQSIGQHITGTDIVELPTITRNPYDLVKIAGNVSDADPGGRGVGVAVNGQRGSSVNLLLDGVPNNNEFDTTIGIKTPLDSVGEFTVLSSDFTAEYGRAGGGVINVDTKRGTNAFHGSAYEFNRLSALASNTFENNANGIDKPVFTRNQFGFSVGGPIKKDKIFVFFNPEWIRVRSQNITTYTIPTPQLVAASAPATQQFFAAFGKQKPGLIPLQTFTYGQACTLAACTLLPSNFPAYEKVAYSVPSDSGGGDPQNTYEIAGRVDYVLNDKTQFYFRYAGFDQNALLGTQTNSPYVGFDTAYYFHNQGYALSGTHIFTPTLISQTKLSYNRLENTQPLGANPVGPTLYTTLGSTGSLGGYDVVYPGYSPNTPGNSLPFGGPQNYIQLNEDVTKIWGKHNFRFGGQINYLQDNRVFGAYEEAVEALGTNLSNSINNLITGQLREFQAAVYPQGKFPCVNGVQTPACTITLPVGPPDFSRSNAYHEAALYAQDSWKFNARLTLNLGLRWEYFGPQASRNPNLDSNFYLGSGSNVELQSATGQVLVSTDPKNPIGGLWKKDWRNFAPRIGFAYDLFGDQKTVLRGGYGISYERNFNNVTFNVIQNPPNYGVIGLIAGADVPTIPITNNNAGPLAGSSGTKALPAVTLRAVDPNIKTAYAHQWSTALEHQFSPDMIGALEYSGSDGVNLYAIDRLNIPGSALVYAGTGGPTTPLNPQYSLINYRTNGGFSHYNGLNTRFELRNFRRQGLTMIFNYTWSHAIDNLSSTFGGSDAANDQNLGFLDPLHPGLDKGSADFDVRHRVSVVAEYNVPFKNGSNKVLNEVAGGWSIDPLFSARTGTPFSMFDCTNEAYALCPRIMYDQPFHAVYTNTPTSTAGVFTYMNLGNFDSSYVNPLTGVSDFGPYPSTMLGRNVFRTPGIWTFNFAVHKNFDLTERFKLQFRAEAFNLFNHSNLYIVYANSDGSATTAMTAIRGERLDNYFLSPPATSENGRLENRNLQLALKLLF